MLAGHEPAFYREEDWPLDQSGLVQKYFVVQLTAVCVRCVQRCDGAEWDGMVGQELSWDQMTAHVLHVGFERVGIPKTARYRAIKNWTS